MQSFLQWDAAQVSSYLNQTIPIGSQFLDNNVDGSLLPFLTTEHLRDMGIEPLSARLAIKKAISELIAEQARQNSPQSLRDPQHKLHNINSNYIPMEAMSIATVLVSDMFAKLGQWVQKQNLPADSPMSPVPQSQFQLQQLEHRKLQDNFLKLKTDLIPVIRLLKDSKPLPTPTLDPGHASSPTYSVNSEWDESSINPPSEATLLNPLSHPNLVSSPSVASSRASFSAPSPTSRRFSQEGKIVSQSAPKIDAWPQVEFQLPKKKEERRGSKERPRLTGGNSSTSIASVKPSLKHQHSSGSVSKVEPSMEPLQQLRASSEDSCVKILQQAMRRHRIPRDDWSTYVLVICYGDKERILKLDEKPVIIFKELQGMGKNPAIMLRQLAKDVGKVEYENSRIGDDIPGGTL